MKNLTVETIRGWQASPNLTIQKVQNEFARKYLAERRAQPLATNRAIILNILEDPIWSEYGNIGSYATGRKVLDRVIPGWNLHDTEEEEV